MAIGEDPRPLDGEVTGADERAESEASVDGAAPTADESVADAVPPVAEVPVADAVPVVAEVPVADAAPVADDAPVAEAPSPESRVAAPPVPGATPAPPTAGERRRPPAPPGKILEGAVTAVRPDEVELRLDDGRAAVINRANFGPNDDDISAVLSIGDRAFGAELSRTDPKKRVVLSRAWALKRQAWDRIAEVAATSATLTGTVTSAGAKGLVVDVGVRGFVPSSHLELEAPTDLSGYVGKVLELKVLEADPRRERLVLSRRSLLMREQRRKTQEMLSSLTKGDTTSGTVTSLTDYGAFVDIGGVNGLVHLSELSWQRVRKPSDVVAVGDEVEVKILDVKAKKRRVSLSMRQLAADPLSELEIGSVHTGRVTKLVDFGAFVSLGDIEGLVHLSELSEYRVSSPAEVVAPGDEVGVKILSVDTKRRRIELSIRRAAEFSG